MILESIELRNVSLFTAPVNVGPFDEGLNVLAAQNETGKSTLLMAATRTLFDRHTVTGDVIQRLRPVGTALAPEITVTFTCPEGRFRIHKRFLDAPKSELSEDRAGQWHLIAEGDAADEKVLRLVGGIRSARGASKAEHWGLLRYLWARQGESTQWPTWEDDAGVSLRDGLARIEIDPLIERMRDSFDAMQSGQYTATGKIRRNSTLDAIRTKIIDTEKELAEVRFAMEEIEQSQQELQRSTEELIVRENEKKEAERRAGELTTQLKEIELLRKDLERFEASFDTAGRRLKDVDGDHQALKEARASLSVAARQLEKAEKDLAGKTEEEKEIRDTLADLQSQAKRKQRKLDENRKRLDRLRELQEMCGAGESLAALEKRLDRARKEKHGLDTLRRRRAALPDVGRDTLRRLQKQEENLRELVLRSEAVGLRARIEPKYDGSISVTHDGAGEDITLVKGETTILSAARDLRLSIPDWGTIDIVSGAEEVAELEEKISESRQALEEQLKTLSVASVSQAQIFCEQVMDLDREITVAEERLADMLDEWAAVDELQAEVDAAEADITKRKARLNLDEGESSLSIAELKAEGAKLQTDMDSTEGEWTTLQESVEERQGGLEELAVSQAKVLEAVSDARSEPATLEARINTIEQRYPEGVEKARQAAQEAFIYAKAELEVAQKKLPEDWDKIEARHERMLKAAEAAASEFQAIQRRISGLEAVLHQAGSRGLYSREAELMEELESAHSEEAALRRQATAARLLVGLIDHRKKAAVQTVLTPLEGELSAAFAELTGDHTRRVFLDENLQIAGIGRNREETIVFDQLSQGAREQLLLALRAAVALNLAENGPQTLILDDVLVNTDSVRQQHVLDFIQNVAERVQVLIVTCHAERYRGVGSPLALLDNSFSPSTSGKPN